MKLQIVKKFRTTYSTKKETKLETFYIQWGNSCQPQLIFIYHFLIWKLGFILTTSTNEELDFHTNLWHVLERLLIRNRPGLTTWILISSVFTWNLNVVIRYDLTWNPTGPPENLYKKFRLTETWPERFVSNQVRVRSGFRLWSYLTWAELSGSYYLTAVDRFRALDLIDFNFFSFLSFHTIIGQ